MSFFYSCRLRCVAIAHLHRKLYALFCDRVMTHPLTWGIFRNRNGCDLITQESHCFCCGSVKIPSLVLGYHGYYQLSQRRQNLWRHLITGPADNGQLLSDQPCSVSYGPHGKRLPRKTQLRYNRSFQYGSGECHPRKFLSPFYRYSLCTAQQFKRTQDTFLRTRKRR